MSELIYTIPTNMHNIEKVKMILSEHPEIQFVSLMGIDLGGNATDEKIPVKAFVEDMETFLTGGVQTDGSSVVLHGIATLNNARLDIIPDLSVNWFVDYNYDNTSEINGLPVGTLRIPSFLVHNNNFVDSRSILKRAVKHFEGELMELFKSNEALVKSFGINSVEEIEKVVLTSATELEFWVKTPEEKISVEELSTSQVLKEQYWKRTQGVVRTALEKAINLMSKYGFEPEMGHKEVGGVSSRIGTSGKQKHVMEQLEIDWKYSTAVQAADNELMIRELVGDVFKNHGLEITFAAKPIEGVAGSGEHTHVGAAIKLKNGKIKNVFAPEDMSKDYMSVVGFGALMGLLKNYEVINPFVASSNDAFNRLKPGFEAPVCIVTSLGHDVDNPSRNRSVLAGLIRDMENPLATRFELRSPNPLSNTYLVIAAVYQAMLDGISAAVKSGKNAGELEREISKDYGAESFYLEKDRMYRSEEDVFEHYTQVERNKFFGTPPATVVENMKSFDVFEDKKQVLLRGNVFTNIIIESYKLAEISQWETELDGRILYDNTSVVRECKKLHGSECITDLDVVVWEKINSIRYYLMKDSLDTKSLFTKIREALDNKDYDRASELQVEMSERITEIKDLYIMYKRNLFEIAE
jgi:glutamine synthetase